MDSILFIGSSFLFESNTQRSSAHIGVFANNNKKPTKQEVVNK